MGSYPLGLYGSGMHDFVMRELEIGRRAATYEDLEACGWSALMDLSYEQYIAADGYDRKLDWGSSL